MLDQLFSMKIIKAEDTDNNVNHTHF